jgi:hypothetical protein
MSQLMGLVESTKITLDNREGLVVDLSIELGKRTSRWSRWPPKSKSLRSK